MMYDIAAVQEMYGANFNTNGGDTVYKWNPVTGEMSINGLGQGAPAGNKVFMTVWDGGGHDTYDFSNYSTDLSVNLQPGAWTTASTAQLANLGGGHYAAGNIANALLYHGNTASLIEDVIGGSGNDKIIGNAANNHFTGAAGNDTLDGSAGTDTAVYAGNHDNFVWAENADGSWTVTDLTGAQGVDTLWDIENLQFTDTIVSIGTAPPVVTNAAPTVTSATSQVSLTEWANNSTAEASNTPHTATGKITYSDADVGQTHTASVKSQGTNYLGTFSLNTNNIDSSQSLDWSFTVSDSAIDYLKAGQTLTQKYDVTIDDGHGGTTLQTITVTLLGADDATTRVSKGPGKGPGKGNGNDVPPGDNPGSGGDYFVTSDITNDAIVGENRGDSQFVISDVPSLLDMMNDQAPAPYQSLADLHWSDAVQVPGAVVSALTPAADSLWHV